jgi:cytoskeletal protein RodZ
LLKKRREQLGLSLERAEEDLKIRKKYLSALEKNLFDDLPSVAYIQGFVRNYSRFLDLDEEKVLAVFRRQFNKIREQKIVPPGVTKPLDEPIVRITPQRAAFFTAIVLLGAFFIYMFTQLKTLTGSPNLIVREPSEDKVVASRTLVIEGETSSGAEVFVNGQPAKVSKDNVFSYNYRLKEGVNEIIIEAVGENGKKTSITRNIRYKP